MEVNISNDLSKLTTIQEAYINKLLGKVSWCICNAVEEAQNNGDNIANIKFEFGTVSVIIGEDEIKYKFVPSKSLEEQLIKTIVERKNPLVDEITTNLVQRISNIYKDMF